MKKQESKERREKTIFYGEVSVPDGSYVGVQGGYEVEMDVKGQMVIFRTEKGVRGIDIPVKVMVTDGEPEVIFTRS